MEHFAHGRADAALRLYRSLVSPSYLEEVRRGFPKAGGWGLFSPALTVWLMVRGRLLGGCSLERAWQECSPEEALLLSPDSARARRGSLSPNPTGLAYARQAIPLAVVEAAADRLYEEALCSLGPEERPTYLVDGSSLRAAHAPALARAYPPASNQHGDSHWPVLRILVAHDLRTGLAVRPEWGPMYGEGAVSEQGLARRLRERLPKGCAIVADRNFGVFQIAWLFKGNVLLRLTSPRAGALLGKGRSLESDWDERVVWRPSASERKACPDYPEDAAVEGRLVVRHLLVPGRKGRVPLYLFTDDLQSPAEEIVARYPARWSVETDLRSLKRVVGLELLRARTPDVLAKEIVLAVAAFNLVRTLMALAASKAGVEPRRIGFTRACNAVEIHARRGVASQADFDRMLDDIGARPLPDRTGRRAPPRRVWKKANSYPSRSVANG
jgi:hypothetical protein